MQVNKITAEDILPLLKKVRRSGRGWTACCPSHEDRRPSFSIADGERGLMMHCFAGCTIDQIKAALGMESHAFTAPIVRRPKIERSPLPNPFALWKGWQRDTNLSHLDGFAMSLGVDTDSLQAVGCAWARNAWAFPMKNHNGNVIGIRLRSDDGRKWAIKGSQQGLFIPTNYPYCVDDGTMYIVEGPTDLAAAMTIGLYSIGRPSCLGQENMIVDYLRTNKVRRAVICSDNDTPGLNGARKLQERLPLRSCIWVPPFKDVRAFVQRGGTATMIENSVRDLVWRAA